MALFSCQAEGLIAGVPSVGDWRMFEVVTARAEMGRQPWGARAHGGVSLRCAPPCAYRCTLYSTDLGGLPLARVCSNGHPMVQRYFLSRATAAFVTSAYQKLLIATRGSVEISFSLRSVAERHGIFVGPQSRTVREEG
jgi:hypothetical protein